MTQQEAFAVTMPVIEDLTTPQEASQRAHTLQQTGYQQLGSNHQQEVLIHVNQNAPMIMSNATSPKSVPIISSSHALISPVRSMRPLNIEETELSSADLESIAILYDKVRQLFRGKNQLVNSEEL